jgi:Asp-tRNA(Asn)/Glu-tRNA(Gln) amidotransferase A subunit family amidase
MSALTGTTLEQRSPAATLTFGRPDGYLLAMLDPEVRERFEQAVRTLETAGHRVHPLEIPHADLTPDVYLHIVLPEASEYHAPLLEKHGDRYSPNVRLRLEMGRYILAEDYVRALRLRDRLTAAVDAALERCDALILPGMAIPAPLLGASTAAIDGTAQPVRALMLRLTQLFNLTGHPAIVLPAGSAANGLPIALQLVGTRGRTAALIDIAAGVEPLIGPGPR